MACLLAVTLLVTLQLTSCLSAGTSAHVFMMFVGYLGPLANLGYMIKTHQERWINPVKPTGGLAAELTKLWFCCFATRKFFCLDAPFMGFQDLILHSW